MGFEAVQVGELARRTGLTVRTLHHYDEIGLLRPSQHSGAGYRLYTARDIARLQQIVSLRQLGFSLQEIRDCLDRPGYSPLEVVGRHLTQLREQIALQQRLSKWLEGIAARFESAEEVSADQFLQTIEAVMMTEKYFTPEQQAFMQSRREAAGEELLRRQEVEWTELLANIRSEMDAGTDPADAKVQALAKRWNEILHEGTGGDQQIEESVKRLWSEQGDVLAAQHGAQYDPRPVYGYIMKAIAAAKSASCSSEQDRS
jgi:MerR family transcriptional regulator, thiopeptide resistance regulator